MVVLAAILLSGGGGSNSPSTATTAHSTASGGHHGHAVVASPAETHVIVLNATEAEGLGAQAGGEPAPERIHAGGRLEREASKRPLDLGGRVRERASHRSAARGQTLGIGEVTPMEGAVAVGGERHGRGRDRRRRQGIAGRLRDGEAAASEGAAGGSSGAGEAQGNEAPAASETPAGEASAGAG